MTDPRLDDTGLSSNGDLNPTPLLEAAKDYAQRHVGDYDTQVLAFAEGAAWTVNDSIRLSIAEWEALLRREKVTIMHPPLTIEPPEYEGEDE